VLARATAPVLDIGCGPGRHLAALAAAGHEGLGLDLSPVAVRLARARGAEVILRSVFADVPSAGTWRTALLLDGNIGIGGAPAALLARARALVAPGGAVLVETGPPGAPTRRIRVRLETPGAVSPWFGWATVGAGAIASLARAAGLRPRATFAAGGRWFARLERP
jgi:SAM-dependent methyltransferase